MFSIAAGPYTISASSSAGLPETLLNNKGPVRGIAKLTLYSKAIVIKQHGIGIETDTLPIPTDWLPFPKLRGDGWHLSRELVDLPTPLSSALVSHPPLPSLEIHTRVLYSWEFHSVRRSWLSLVIQLDQRFILHGINVLIFNLHFIYLFRKRWARVTQASGSGDLFSHHVDSRDQSRGFRLTASTFLSHRALSHSQILGFSGCPILTSNLFL